MRIAKWTAIILGGLVLLVIATAFVLTSVVDPNRYRGKLAGIVGDLSGKPFVIEGDLAITWYPWLGVRTGRAHLDEPALVEWQSITVSAKLWPLLHGEVVADRIRVQGPHVHLRRDAQGRGNWEGLGGDRQGGSSGKPVQIAGLEIREGTVDYVDEATGKQVTLANVDLDIGEFRGEQPLPVHARFLAHGGPLPPTGVWVELNAPELAIRPTPLSVAAPKLTVKVANTQAEGDLSYEQGAGPAKPTVKVANAQAEGDRSYEQVAGSGPGMQAAATGSRGIAVRTRRPDVDAPGRDTVDLASAAHSQAAEAHSQANDSFVRAHGTVRIHSASLREFMTTLGLNQTLPHDPTTLGPLDLNTTWTYADGAITAKPLALKLDEVSFNGWLQRTAPPTAMWDFELHGDRIDLGRYVNLDSKNKKPFELPVETLRAIRANGSLIFDQLVLADTHMTDVRLKLQTPEGNP